MRYQSCLGENHVPVCVYKCLLLSLRKCTIITKRSTHIIGSSHGCFFIVLFRVITSLSIILDEEHFVLTPNYPVVR